MSRTQQHDYFEALLVKATDGLLTANEQAELDRHLQTCAECREDLADFQQIKEATDAMTTRILQDAQLEPPRPAPAARGLLSLSFALVVVGLLLLLGFGAVTLFADPTVPLWVKLGLGIAGVGTLGLLAYVIAVRVRGRGLDPYREVDR